ncbi:PREDICTED: uncharacterized protein LOC108448330 isoform X1 [Corvus brachyrhynchos]|uniref:uncharacterized protein LOC108448330 isoform X1 n=1 Tax=Corvus brachyrhynchos TaxID=85066 RepID=UPI0008166072|nr:PREDICTED: uncharacterized protein LOC108448330 isoform X1 [Corvus brachyrhynchos]
MKRSRGESKRNTEPLTCHSCGSGTVSELEEPGTTVQCEICLENLTMQVHRCKLKCLEVKNQTNIVVPGENCMNFTSSNMSTAHTGICMCRVFITRPNSTDTGNSTQAAVLSCGSAESQTDVTEKIWTGLNLLLCILFGFAVGTLLYMPVIGFLLWQCRRNRTGELMSGEVVKGNQVSMVAPVTGTADLTYANLNFRKKGTGSASSNVIYTEIKPSQQKQSGGDGSAASTEVDVSPKEEGE